VAGGLARRVVAIGLALGLGACAAAAPRPAGAPWQSAFGRDHPLAGRIWDVAHERFIAPEALVGRLSGARFVLLGETHDNQDHHRLQAQVLRALITAGRRPTVAFEMLSTAQAPALARHLATAPTDAAGLGEAVGWSRSGWPDWRLYQPIAEAALGAGLPVVTANVPPAVARALARGDRTALDRGLAARHGLDQGPAPAVETAMAAEIRDSHCGHAPERLVAGMVLAQRVRDAQMAESLATGGDADGAVLIAGAGHVRTDRGVPAYLRARLPGATVASLAFVEVAPERLTPEDYARSLGGTLPFDFVWFTPRANDEDPCVKFRQPLERLRQGG
jgi:uncharacterized iron-regulated protein